MVIRYPRSGEVISALLNNSLPDYLRTDYAFFVFDLHHREGYKPEEIITAERYLMAKGLISPEYVQNNPAYRVGNADVSSAQPAPTLKTSSSDVSPRLTINLT